MHLKFYDCWMEEKEEKSVSIKQNTEINEAISCMMSQWRNWLKNKESIKCFLNWTNKKKFNGGIWWLDLKEWKQPTYLWYV